MYLRLRKRKKPLSGDTPSPNAGAVPMVGTQDPPPPSPSDWIPAEPAGDGAAPPDVSNPVHPNRGNAHESARGSHR